MCNTICIDGVWCESIEELRAIVPDFKIADGYTVPIPGRSCLCPVDYDDLGTRFDLVGQAEHDPMAIIYKSKNPATFR